MENIAKVLELEREKELKRVYSKLKRPSTRVQKPLDLKVIILIFKENEQSRFAEVADFLRNSCNIDNTQALRLLTSIQGMRLCGSMLSSTLQYKCKMTMDIYLYLFTISENVDIKIRCAQFLVTNTSVYNTMSVESRDLVERWCFELINDINLDERVRFDIIEVLTKSVNENTITRAKQLFDEFQYRPEPVLERRRYAIDTDIEDAMPTTSIIASSTSIKLINKFAEQVRTVYTDRQNVHTSSINKSMLNVIEKWKPFFTEIVSGPTKPETTVVGDIYLNITNGDLWIFKEKWILEKTMGVKNNSTYKWLIGYAPNSRDYCDDLDKETTWVCCKNLPHVSMYNFCNGWQVHNFVITFEPTIFDFEELIVEELMNADLYSEIISQVLTRIYTDTSMYNGKTMVDILNQVWYKIMKHPCKADLTKRFEEECIDMHRLCSTGHVSRLINVMSVFDPTVNILIDFKSQLSAALSARYYGRIKNSDNVEILAVELCDKTSTIIKDFKEEQRLSLYDEILEEYTDLDIKLFDEIYKQVG